MIRKNCPITGGILTISDSNNIYQLNCRDIEVIYSEDNVSIIQPIKGKSITVSQSLTDIEKQLEQCRFIRINRKELINCNKIRKIDCMTREILMESGKKMTVSSRNIVKMRKKFFG